MGVGADAGATKGVLGDARTARLYASILRRFANNGQTGLDYGGRREGKVARTVGDVCSARARSTAGTSHRTGANARQQSASLGSACSLSGCS